MELKIKSEEKIPNVDTLTKKGRAEKKLYSGGKYLYDAGIAVKTYFKEVYNKVIERDFIQQETITFVKGSITEEDEGKLRTFAEEMEVMNNIKMFNEEKETLMTRLKTTKMDEESQKKVVTIFEEWHDEFLVEWDEKHMRNIIESIENGEKDKMKLELGVYNFSDFEIDQNITEILKQNKKTVIPVDKGIESAIHNFDKELFKYLVSYRRKVEKKQRVEADQNDVKSWLEKALEASDEEDSEFRRFYIGMLKNLDKAYNHIERESKCRSNNIKANELRHKLSFPNNVWNEADKGLGFILLPCETMVEAEKAMAIKLGAEIVDKTAEEIIQLVDEKAVEFERELSENQVRVLEEFMHNRRVPKKDVKLPFLKLNGKIQKLRQDEVEAKEIKKLTFRPVQDSISWSLNNYSYILMLFLREAFQTKKRGNLGNGRKW